MIATPEEIAEIRRHAEADYPSECCGVVVARGAAERLLLKCHNDQDGLHERDPSTHRRDSLSAYHIKEVLDIYRKCDDEDYRVAVIYHSHCNAAAYFSDTDKRNALLQGQPTFPDATYVVISVTSLIRLPRWVWKRLPRSILSRLRRRVAGAGAFRWDAARRDFLPVDFEEFRA